MDNQDIDKSYNNSFSTRGCCKVPDAEGENKGVYKGTCCKLDNHDWLENVNPPGSSPKFDCVEVRFKNSRKEFFRLYSDFDLEVGDIVAVEASPGHDIGIVSMSGELVRLQMKKRNIDPKSNDIKKLYRRARTSDIEKWVKAVSREDSTLFKTRKITSDLNLDMKMNDIEYQGDNTKAVFYYTAEERVDFRQLIKVLAETFKIRIEMRQIGVRQEAARLGGVGSCGRELCCSTWMCNFSSVTTNSARVQQLSLNPQKLAGQCSKLKCCLNFEIDSYQDALKDFPDSNTVLKTKKGDAVHQKTDIYKRLMGYSYKDDYANMMALPVKKVKHIMEMNKRKKFPEKLENFAFVKEQKTNFENVVGQDDLDRFDKMK
ncbi:MAG: hypothetical protein CL663_05045 [Bacteroidetes bacterium]|nr:hypothetical protein [Bacteroidota bacterium]